jgi:hypothetical protein
LSPDRFRVTLEGDDNCATIFKLMGDRRQWGVRYRRSNSMTPERSRTLRPTGGPSISTTSRICQNGLVIDNQTLSSAPQATRINLNNIELLKTASGIQSTGDLLQIMLYVH